MKPLAEATRLTHLGRPFHGWANTPIVKGSTFLFDDMAQWHDVRARRGAERLLSYGARGNETVFALEDAITALEGGYRTKLYPTGLAAIAGALLAYLKAGDHILMFEGCYQPAKRLCSEQLARYGITCSFFAADADWRALLRPETRMVYVESPGSSLYELQDLPAIADECHKRGILVCADNTWGSALAYQPLRLGADISILAATKYLGGHSDVTLGSVTTTAAAFQDLEQTSVNLGQTVSAEDAFLVLRGMRTLRLRMDHHARTALAFAQWLQQYPAITHIWHPALPGDASHALWQRDATGSNGLLTIEFTPELSDAAIEACIDQLALFGIGSSWGGFESLVIPVDPSHTRLAREDRPLGYLMRIHTGLEDLQDLQADFSQAFAAVLTPQR